MNLITTYRARFTGRKIHRRLEDPFEKWSVTVEAYDAEAARFVVENYYEVTGEIEVERVAHVE